MMDLSRVRWRKSHRSTQNGSCVEIASAVADLDVAVALRDSKDPDGPKLIISLSEWSLLTAGVRSGEYDLR